MTRIKKVKLFSLARVVMVISSVAGLIISITSSYHLISQGISNFIFVVVLITVGYTLLGFIVGLLVAVVYNITFKLHGGIKVETEQL